MAGQDCFFSLILLTCAPLGPEDTLSRLLVLFSAWGGEFAAAATSRAHVLAQRVNSHSAADAQADGSDLDRHNQAVATQRHGLDDQQPIPVAQAKLLFDNSEYIGRARGPGGQENGAQLMRIAGLT